MSVYLGEVGGIEITRTGEPYNCVLGKVTSALMSVASALTLIWILMARALRL